MPLATQLQPLASGRATEIFEMLKTAHEDESKAIALDEQGFATGVVDVEDPLEEHVLGDLDVHA